MGDELNKGGQGTTDSAEGAEAPKAGEGAGEGTGAAGEAGKAAAGAEGAAGQGEGAAEAGAEGAGGGGEAAKAPETYTLKLPEGSRIDESDLAVVADVAKRKGWTNEQAQAALEEHAAALDAQAEAFLEQTQADATYGGDKLADTQRLAKSVLDRVRPAGTPRGDALRSLLHKSGYGNNLEVIAFLADLGKLMSEDGGLSSGAAGTTEGGDRPPEEVLYGSSS